MMKLIYRQLSEFGIEKDQTCELPFPGSSRRAIAIEINRLNRYELWDHFKNLTKETGLQPLVTATWSATQNGWQRWSQIFEQRPS